MLEDTLQETAKSTHLKTAFDILYWAENLGFWVEQELARWDMCLRMPNAGTVMRAVRDPRKYNALLESVRLTKGANPNEVRLEEHDLQGFIVYFKTSDEQWIGVRVTGPEFDPAFMW